MQAHPAESPQTLVLSYLAIRRAIGYVGLSLPILLGPIGWLVHGIGLQENMSSYYHTPMRDIFVGVMCAIGIFLFCYRGYSRWEEWTGNVSCVSAIVIALCPLDANSDPLHQRTFVGYMHSAAGAAFFTTLAVYSLFHFPRRKSEDSLPETSHPSELDRRARNLVYYVSGGVIVLCLIAMGSSFFLMPTRLRETLDSWGFVFWMEWIAVWAFSAAWLAKGRALFADVAVPLGRLQQIIRRR
ncbi:MAG: hypothetical protein R3C49_19275 [Planctomycetaceae bacterium]